MEDGRGYLLNQHPTAARDASTTEQTSQACTLQFGITQHNDTYEATSQRVHSAPLW